MCVCVCWNDMISETEIVGFDADPCRMVDQERNQDPKQEVLYPELPR